MVFESIQTPYRRNFPVIQNKLRQHLTNRRPVLESMPRSSTDQPDIFVLRMAVDDEMTVRRLLILADTRFDQRCIFQGREAEGDVFTDILQRFGIDYAFAARWIEVRSAGVVGDLESTAIAAWDAVVKLATMICPHRTVRIVESCVSRRSAKEEDVLLGGADKITYRLRE